GLYRFSLDHSGMIPTDLNTITIPLHETGVRFEIPSVGKNPKGRTIQSGGERCFTLSADSTRGTHRRHRNQRARLVWIRAAAGGDRGTLRSAAGMRGLGVGYIDGKFHRYGRTNPASRRGAHRVSRL